MSHGSYSSDSSSGARYIGRFGFIPAAKRRNDAHILSAQPGYDFFRILRNDKPV